MHRLPLRHRHDHFPSLAAVVFTHDSIFCHVVNQLGSPAVTNAKTALQQGTGSATFPDDNFDSAVIQLVPFLDLLHRRSIGTLAVLVDFQIHQLADKVLLTLAAMVTDTVDFLIGKKGSLPSDQGAGTRPQKQHIAVAQQFVSPIFIQYYTTIRLACDLKTQTCRQVTFDQTGDDINRRFLSCEDQVDPHCATFLCQSNDVLLNIFACRHHQVCHFIRDNHDEWQFFRYISGRVGLIDLQTPHDLISPQIIETVDMTNTHFGKQRVPLFHFFDGPRQNRFRLLHVGDHWMHQVGQTPVATQFDHFGVDHQHPHLIRPAAHQHRCDDGIETNALTGTCPTRNQQVGHLRQVNHHGISRNILAQKYRDVHFG